MLYRSLLDNKIGKFILNTNFRRRYSSSIDYWEKRYLNKGTSGLGSYGEAAIYKSEFLNQFVIKNNVLSVIEFGCGDGNQIKQFKFQNYTGLDISQTAIDKCKNLFKNDLSKRFYFYTPNEVADKQKLFNEELALSLDVVYHLTEDLIFENYMYYLFSSATRFVIIYAWDMEGKKNLHVKHRRFTEWIGRNIRDWQLTARIENKNSKPMCDFFIYSKIESQA